MRNAEFTPICRRQAKNLPIFGKLVAVLNYVATAIFAEIRDGKTATNGLPTRLPTLGVNGCMNRESANLTVGWTTNLKTNQVSFSANNRARQQYDEDEEDKPRAKLSCWLDEMHLTPNNEGISCKTERQTPEESEEAQEFCWNECREF